LCTLFFYSLFLLFLKHSMQEKVLKHNETFIALTALWAFVESGLGGFMHALHLPFTGIFLGGFSVVIISLIAHFEPKPYQKIIKATLIVMAVKASVNPMTPPTAYIAVGFQGLIGALIYSINHRSAFISMLFAILAILESAFQKLLVLTIIFGTAWYKAIDKFFESILKSLSIDSDASYAFSIVLIYLLIYGIWAILLGWWIHKIPQQIESRAHLYRQLVPITPELNTQKKRKKPLLVIITLLILLMAYFMPDKKGGLVALTLVIRTSAIVLLWILLIAPFWKAYVLKKIQNRKDEETPLVMARMPYLSERIKPLLNEVKLQHKGIRKWREFILGLIVISLHYDSSDK
jgi:hypothetical protein